MSIRPDLLVSFSAPFNMIALVGFMYSGIKIIVSERVDPVSFRWGAVKRCMRDILYKRANGILVQTLSSKKHLHASLQTKAEVIPNPILMPDSFIGASLDIKKNHWIVSVGRLSHQKRFDVLIYAFHKFQKTHPDYKLIIYGEGNEREFLQKLILQLNLHDKVEMPGITNELWDNIKTANMFVMTSEFEGMSNVLMEAMCLGLPCVSTRVSGAVDYIEDGVNGLLVDRNDDVALYNAMSEIADDNLLAMHLGNNASNVYEKIKKSVIEKQWLNYIDSYVGL